jgi:hypothetical protein
MDPITATLLILAVVGTTAATAMSYQAQTQAAKQTSYNAEYEAKAEEIKAEEEKAQRAAQERMERRQTRSRRASIEAGFAKSGLLMTGTPTYLLEEQAKSDEMNIGEANRQQKTSFMRSMERASIIRQQGKFQSESLKYGATTTLISGASSLAMQGATFGAAGGFGPGKTPPPAGGGGVIAADAGSQGFANDLTAGKYAVKGDTNSLFNLNP